MKEFIKFIVAFILTLEARAVIAINKPKIIAITGSAGKTSTKEATFATISRHAYVRKSEKSFNNEFGIPLTILGLPTGWGNPFKWLMNILEGFWIILWPTKYPEWLILEVGTRTPGDIASLTKWLHPDIVIMTSFGEKTPVHIEFFSSREAVLEEKKQLARALKDNGTLILNYDDDAILSTRDEVQRKIITYGYDDDADFVINNEKIEYEEGSGKPKTPSGINFRLDYDGNSLPISIPGVLGAGQAYSGAAAVATLHVCGFSILEASQALADYPTPPGRMKLIEGVKNTLIIDDTYNASPLSITHALNTLREIETKGRKIAVLGDMLELGTFAEEEHKKMGKLAAELCDVLVFVGARGNFYVEGALSIDFPDNNLQHFDESMKAGKFVEQLIKEGDVILIKGSQGVRMERAVKEIMQHPEIAQYKLCRQEKTWLAQK